MKRFMMTRMIGLSLLFPLHPFSIHAQEAATRGLRTGSIHGQLRSLDTRLALPRATVTIVDTAFSTTTDEKGNFRLSDVPVGSYLIQFLYSGIPPVTLTDVIVKSNMSTLVQAEMDISPSTNVSITVTSQYFPTEEAKPSSTTAFSSEEIRRAPGAGGDVSRIIAALPSLAKVSEEWNGLIVRGGNANENLFLVDNMEIPNINHYPVQGSSGGPISLLNVDFIRDVEFSAGGFPVMYGDKLSSVMNIGLREGNREKVEAQTFMDMAGFGFTGEGPLKGKGSWMASVRRSYLDLLSGSIEGGNVPRFADFQGKLVWDLGNTGRISFLAIGGVDDLKWTRLNSLKENDNHYGTVHNREYTAGVNWLWLWGEKGYSETSFAGASYRYQENVLKTVSSSLLFDNRSLENIYALRNANHLILNDQARLNFGVEVKRLRGEYNAFMAEYTDVLGHVVPEAYQKAALPTSKLSGFASGVFDLLPRVTVDMGGRVDHFFCNRHTHFSPRLSLTYRLTDKTKLSASTGIYYQNLPLDLLSQNPTNRRLADPRALHLILGVSHLLTDSTRLTVEAYDKRYSHFPMDPTLPQLFLFDNTNEDSIFTQNALVDTGKARSQGIEMVIQKKLKEKIYGTIGASIFKTTYQDLLGTWRSRISNNRFLISLQGGYKPAGSWEFSAKWLYAGGRPYTPFDLEASTNANAGILDVTQINKGRLPAYHSLSVRVEKRFCFWRSNLGLYLDLWNAYNRTNVARYYWNEVKNKPGVKKEWEIMPIVGAQFNF